VVSIFGSEGYKKPPQKIVDIFNNPWPGYIRYDNFEKIGVKINYRQMIDLKTLSRKTYELAGEEISPVLNGPIEKYPYYDIKFYNYKNNRFEKINLEKDTIVREIKRSPNNKRYAFTTSTDDGIKIFVGDVKKNKHHQLKKIRVNDCFDTSNFFWIDDNRLLVKSVPFNREQKPRKSRVPSSPVVKETKKSKSKMRTYTNLINNEFEKKLFGYYFSSQIIIYNFREDKIKKVGSAGLFDEVSVSPDNKYILLEKIKKPYSYRVPYYFFARDFVVWDIEGNLVRKIYQRPLSEEIPIGGTFEGPRYMHWHPNKKSSLVWITALDQGDPEKEVKKRDKVVLSSYPFKNSKTLFKSKYRLYQLEWGEKPNSCIYYERDRDNMQIYGYYLNYNSNNVQKIVDRSYRNSYKEMGDLVKKSNRFDRKVFMQNGQNVYFINNEGDSPEGKYPYLSKFNLKDKKEEIIYKSRKNSFETIEAVLEKDFSKILIEHQTKTEPENYYIVDLNERTRKKITDNKNPYPEITDTEQRIIRYKRSDGVSLVGKLYLPPGYENEKRLPLIVWAYPLEYKSKKVAGQLKSSPNKFMKFWGASINYLLLEGYAVVNASVPIVGDPKTVNDTFTKQTVESVKAVLDYLYKKEIIDPERVSVSGPSYGAFMVGNVLAHSNICKIGVARSGAYNRSLTPFGFQHERRTLWEATQFYIDVSPYFHADKIKEPLLMIHGENDPNSGTYPLQTKRMYQAIKGTGGTARMVLLPEEGHGYRAKKSNLHVIAEMIEWCNKYLK